MLPTSIKAGIDRAIASDDAVGVRDAWRKIYNHVDSVEITYWPPLAVDAMCYVLIRASELNRYPLREVANELMHSWHDVPDDGRDRIVKAMMPILPKTRDEWTIADFLDCVLHPLEGDVGIARCTQLYRECPSLRPHILAGLGDRAMTATEPVSRERYRRARTELLSSEHEA